MDEDELYDTTNDRLYDTIHEAVSDALEDHHKDGNHVLSLVFNVAFDLNVSFSIHKDLKSPQIARN